jgi:8-amino-7-oxononanoate synthase
LSGRSLDEFARKKLRSLERRQLRRELATVDRFDDCRVVADDETLLSFACNDYLGLTRHPDVIGAGIEATRTFGTGAGASRLITGSHSLYRDLERALAELKQTEDAVVFGSGYLANIGIIPLLAGKPDLLLIDELAHSCMLTGAKLSNAMVIAFPHNDTGAVGRLLSAHRSQYRHCLLLTEGVFSMEGDLAPLPAFAALADSHDAWLLTDDAHALGVVGGGRGSSFAHAMPVDVPLQMGTLSKAAGGYGGYLCASRGVAELVRNRARSFVYSTGLPPGTVAAATKALAIIRDDPDRVGRPLELARQFTAALDLPPAQSAIVSLTIGANEATLAASRALRRAGFLVAAIRPPTVPEGTARLRFTFSATHSDAAVESLIAAVGKLELDCLAPRGHDAA